MKGEGDGAVRALADVAALFADEGGGEAAAVEEKDGLLLFREPGIDGGDEAFAKDGTKPKASEGLNFFNTGVNLVTDKPANGVKSIDSKEGTAKCWG